MRSTKQFLAFARQLDRELETSSELFLKQRPFLEGGKGEILSQTDEETIEKVENETAIEQIVKKLKTL